jgi:hypothetical protein
MMKTNRNQKANAINAGLFEIPAVADLLTDGCGKVFGY